MIPRFSSLCLCVALVMISSAVLSGVRVTAVEPVRISPNEVEAGLGLAHHGLSLSPDGRWLLFSTTKGQAFTDLDSGRMFNAPKGWQMISRTPVAEWSDEGDKLVLSVRREGRNALTLWPTGQPTNSPDVRELLVFPRRLYVHYPSTWSADGRFLFLIVNQNLPWRREHPSRDNPPTRNNNVTVKLSGGYDRKQEIPRFEKEYEEAYAESNRSLLLVLEVATGRLGLLAKGNDVDRLYPSPDGRHLVAVQMKSNSNKELPGMWAGQLLGDFYHFDLANLDLATLPAIDLEKFDDRRAGWSDYRGERLSPILRDVQTNNTAAFFPPMQSYGTNGNPIVVWSPDSTRFAYATVGRQSTGDVFVYDLATSALRNLTADLALPANTKGLGYGENLTHSYTSAKFGGLFNPLWLPEGSALVAIARGDVWLLPWAAGTAPRPLTKELRDEAVRIVPAPNLCVASIDESGRVAVVTKDRMTRQDQVWRVAVTGETKERVADLAVWNNLTLATDMAGRRLVYSGQSIQTTANLHEVALQPAAAPRAVTRFRDQLASRRVPRVEVLSWRTPDGYPGFGLLYLPERESEGGRYPLIFNGYPSQEESRLDVRAKAGASFFNDSLMGLLDEGFAVLHADIPMSDVGVYERPMWQVIAGVNTAIDTVLTTGLVDESRMGIMGTSYGGIMVNAVLTQTKRFKAGASLAGLSNWYADYMGGGDVSGRYHELGQGRFVKQLWQDPQRYVENSPITYFDRIDTPLLIIHGENDVRVVFRHAQETFRGLEHLKKNVVFAHYARMGHGINTEAHNRVRGWFREHLLGGEPITHLADQPSFLFGGGQEGDEPGEPADPAPPPPGPPAPPYFPQPPAR